MTGRHYLDFFAPGEKTHPGLHSLFHVTDEKMRVGFRDQSAKLYCCARCHGTAFEVGDVWEPSEVDNGQLHFFLRCPKCKWEVGISG